MHCVRNNLGALFVGMWLAAPVMAAPSLEDVRAMMQAGELEQARTALEGYMARRGDDPKARFLKGLVHARLEERAQAIELFKGLVRDYPELPEPYNNLAVLYAAEGDYEQARDALQRAIGTHPSYATAHENLGDIYARMAASAYDKALTLDEQNTTAEAKLALVNELFPNAADEDLPAVGAMVTSDGAAPVPAEPVQATTQELLAATYAWATAWSARDVEAYLDAYSEDFRPGGGQSRPAWAAERRRRVTGPEFIDVNIEAPEVVLDADGSAMVRFVQSYRSDTYQDRVVKTLELVREDGEWKIVRERSRAL